MMLEALSLFGVQEVSGAADNPRILAWAKEIDVDDVLRHDSTPWCGLFVGLCAKRATWPVVKNPLWALNWSRWGVGVPRPELGDVLTFKREGGGHVGMYVGEDNVAYHVLGGNQSDSVKIARIEKARLVAARRPEWRIAEPPNRRPVRLSVSGRLSVNEA